MQPRSTGLLTATLFFTAASAWAAERTTPIGAAKVDVTPGYHVRLSGYGNRRAESAGVAQRIWAKALAIGPDTAGGPAVLITLENCGITRTIRDRVARRLESAVGLHDSHLVITTTHTHTAPCLVDLLPYLFSVDVPPHHQARIERYTAELTEKLVEVASSAIANRRPGQLWWGAGQARFAKNRRGREAQPVDHSLPILVAKDSTQKLIAIVANYACHCTTLPGEFNRIAGDWAGYAQEYIERNHPGAVALITIGCGADANPAARGGLAECQQHGREIAAEVERLLGTELSSLNGPLACRSLQVELPFQTPPTVDELQRRAQQGGPAGYHAQQLLSRLQQQQPLSESLSYPVTAWTFGDDLAMVFLGGEVVVDYAIRLKSELDAARLWVTAYANDVPCYIPSRRILREGGYEAESSMIYYGQPTRLAPETEEIVVDTVLKLLPHRFYAAETQRDLPPPKSPQEALASLRTLPGFKVELVAAEPLVADPVAFDWAPDGSLWVAEMADYPNGLGWQQAGDPAGRPGGRIRVLRDDDGDGQYDRSTVFLDHLSFPNGIKVWRNGVLVTAAPEILFATDTDGDDVADERQVLYRGFGEGNQQHRVNGMRWGIDSWLYLANGDSGGIIKSLATGESLDIRGRDLKIRPDDGRLAACAGQTQFGRSQDDEGNWFGGNNSNPMWHYVLDDHYLRRNPSFVPPRVRRQVSVQPGAAPVFPISRTLARFNDFDKTDRFTSACSPIVFRHAAADQRRFAYVCEPVHNLVHREIIERQGVSFRSHRAAGEETTEFLASDDNWFRPVMVRTGPDGALWIADMYRFVIEHPTWVPAAWQRKLDLRAGHDRGRIYRVRLPGIPDTANWQTSRVPRLDRLDTAGQVAALQSPNGTLRDMAHQLLLWSRDAAAVGQLKQLLRSPRQAPTSLHALYLLHEFQALDDELLAASISSSNPLVARHAIRLAEQRLDRSARIAEACLQRLKKSADDPLSLQEKLQLAYSLGYWDDPRAAEALAQLALRYRDNDYLSAAVLSSINERNLADVMQSVLSSAPQQPPPQSLAADLLRTAVSGPVPVTAAVDRAVAVICQRPVQAPFQSWQFDLMAGLLDALERRNSSLAQVVDQRTLETTLEMFAAARSVVMDAAASVEMRQQAIRLIGRGPNVRDVDSELFAELLSARTPLALQRAAVRSLHSRVHSKTPALLLQDWDARAPVLRGEILDVLQSRHDWTAQLLDAIRLGRIPVNSIDARRRQQLNQHSDDGIRAQAAAIFATGTTSDRQAVVRQYRSALELQGDVESGKRLFAKHCSKCHRLEGVGHSVGPDLVALTDKSAATLLVALLDPNRAVESKFLDYIALTSDGRQHTGMIISETGSSITLQGPDGKQAQVVRGELEEFRSTGKSLMPEGLERELTPAALADLLAYLRSVRYTPKEFPGNVPQVAPVRDDGSIRLFAMHARIFGPSLSFHEHQRHLANWTRMEDHATWDIDAPRGGTYYVSVTFAPGTGVANNQFLLSVADQALGGAVPAGSDPADFRSINLGTVELPAGRSELLIRSDGPIQGELMRLKMVRLSPAG